VRHSFYPFLHIDLKVKRYKKDKKTTVDKIRPIFYASHLDSLIYSWYAVLLNQKYEAYITAKGISDSVLAYRKIKYDKGNKCNIHFAKEVFDFITTQKECVAIAFDIKSFFDTIDHSLLKESWQQILQESPLPEDHYKIFRSLTKYAYVERNKAFKTLGINLKRKIDRHKFKRICDSENFRNKIRGQNLIIQYPKKFGIPQGSPLSSLLSNIYLANFDETVVEYIKNIGGLYRRYSDDMIVVCPSKNAEDIIKIMENEITKYKLEINGEKTEWIFFEPKKDNSLTLNRAKSSKGLLQYLGFEFNGESMFIRSASISRYYRKMKRRIKKIKKLAIKHNYTGQVFKRRIYEENTHLGKKNFITYAKHALDVTKAETIKKQIKPHWKKVQQEMLGKIQNRTLKDKNRTFRY
jgi:hypothetical protein